MTLREISRPALWIILPICALYIAGMAALLYTLKMDAARGLMIVPLALFGLYLGLYHFRQFLWLMVFLTPLSISIKNLGGGFGASFPVEAMLGLSALIGGIILLRTNFLRREVVRHPITLIIGLQVTWIAATTLVSSYTLVSLKFLVARLAYLIVFYLLFLHLFRDLRNLNRFLWLYLIGFAPVIVHSLNRLAGWGLARAHSPEMSHPFFDDHTVFGACLALLLPAALYFWGHRATALEGLRHRWLIWVAAPLTVAGLTLSFSRAAWLTAIAALGMYGLMRLRVPFRWLLGLLAVLTAGIWLNQDALWERLQQNKTASGNNVLKTAASVTNVSTDDSNRERVNRWASALRMHAERPWMGWGPGTYERNYAIFQITSQKTRISTMKGDRGDAHSEYLGALSEQGIPGLVLQVALFLALIGYGMRAVYRHPDPRARGVGTAVVLGLLTYILHGGVNSFLDLDKVASLFWGMCGMVVALDLHEKHQPLAGNSAGIVNLNLEQEIIIGAAQEKAPPNGQEAV
ncbi:MAG: O-antigen ligase family protein [Bacteroidota bacterium]